MPINYGATIEAGMDAAIVAETLLVEILLESGSLYWSDRAQVDWNGETWLDVGLDIDPGFSDRGGAMTIDNQDNTGSSLVLNNTLRDVELRIYLHYNGDAREKFRGYFSDGELSTDKAILYFDANQYGAALAPRKRIAAPIFTNLPRQGERIRWGDDYIEVQNF